MSDGSLFLAYALLFRLGVIAAGCFTIFLGYSLLRQDSTRRRLSGTASTAEASIPGVRFRLQNVTAGPILTLFGAVLIVAMVSQGNPEKIHQTQVSGGVRLETEMLRGGAHDSIQASILAGKLAQEKGDTEEAEGRYHAALLEVAPAMNALAWIYIKEGKAAEALALSQSAVQLDNSNAHYLDTLAEVKSGVGDRQGALKAIEKAAQIDPSFQPRLKEFLRVGGK
jgi:tetratricopeptide (TPR) repeat protein